MDTGPLVIEETDAGAELVRRFHAYMPVEVAFWVRMTDDLRWTLCIASDEFDDATFDRSYGEALRLVRAMNNPYLESFQVTLIRGSDPLALAALDIQRRYPGNIATRVGGQVLGGTYVEGAYIYPASVVGATALSPPAPTHP